MLPTFFIPGAAKSGTSSLHALLAQHSDIAMTQPKEPHGFALRRWAADPPARYRDLWGDRADRAVRGESSTSTLVCPEALDRIRTWVPDARFVCLLREPVRRTWSHWTWMRAQGLEWRDFRAALLAEGDAPFDPERSLDGNYRSYLRSSRYGEQIAGLHDRFGAERVLVLTTEALRADPLASANLCFRFLGVAPLAAIAPVWANETPRAPWPPAQAAIWGASLRLRRPFGRLGIPLRAAVRAWQQLQPPVGDHPQLPPDDAAWLRARLADDQALLAERLGRTLW